MSLSVPKTHACEAGASGPRQTGAQDIARDLGSSLSSASKRRRGHPLPLSANSMSMVQTTATTKAKRTALMPGTVVTPLPLLNCAGGELCARDAGRPRMRLDEWP